MTNRSRQKDIFLATEADAWFERNREAVARQDFAQDPICRALLDFLPPSSRTPDPFAILEIGCGEGLRLQWLAQQLGARVAGIEPSGQAVSASVARGIDVRRGTAEALPWREGSFDVVIFGFCLYLCDPEDLFRIAAEADRVLKPKSWLVVHDFFAAGHVRQSYHHKPGVMSNKMDFRKLFDWHPAYTCYSHRVAAHSLHGFSDSPQEWVATSVIRKNALDQPQE